MGEIVGQCYLRAHLCSDHPHDGRRKFGFKL